MLLVASGCGLAAEPGEERSGGDATVLDDTRDAFGRPVPDIAADRREAFVVGNSFFTDPWVTAPGSVETRDGLGPVFNANACAGCHVRDGRGQSPEGDEEMVSSLVRISIPGAGPHGEPLGVPGYGDQIQPRAIAGVTPEAATRVTWEEIAGSYADGEAYSLRRPAITIRDAAFGALPADLQTSLRTAPMVFGLGLLECVPEDALLERADPDDADEDGISGRPNLVWDAARGEARLGRFGWKANQPSIAQQNRGAFFGDMGLTSALFPATPCAEGQLECMAAITGGDPEIEDTIGDLVDVYITLLAVPARRGVSEPDVLAGRELFRSAGCESCHRATLTTGDCQGAPELSDQTIHPYTDLLLHDLGDELADGRPDFEASGSEWRTPPLWGLGLLHTVNDHDHLLHDGRARGFAEAILWHGGEAEEAREAFRAMARADREALLAFLASM